MFSVKENSKCSSRQIVYQLRATVFAPLGLENALSKTIDVIQEFIARSVYARLPEDARNHKSFEIKNETRFCECVSIPERLLWTARFKFPSKDKFFWFYDIALIREQDELLIGIKIGLSPGTNLKLAQNRLQLVDKLLNEIGLCQKQLISDKSWHINTDDDVDELLKVLTDHNRSLPVIIISKVSQKSWTFTPTSPDYLVNGEYLASKTKGYAIVVTLGFRAAFKFSERVGKVWSVYDGACRTYYQGIDFEKGISAHHPRNQKDNIWFWKYADKSGPYAYTSFLIDSVHRVASTNRTNWKGLYFIPDARVLKAELDLARATHQANAPEREKAMLNHVDALQRKLNSAVEENTDWLSELDKANAAVEYYKQENASLRLQINVLRAHLARRNIVVDSEVEIPDNYRELPNWVRKHLTGRLILLPRAERAVVKAEYADVSMVYKALLILANEYRNSRIGVGSDKEFKDALAEHWMDFSGSIDKSRAGEEGESYYVNYPIGSNNRELLKFHIERGNSREPRYCMRIYFFWDDETSQVIVGWLPSHLNNRMS